MKSQKGFVVLEGLLILVIIAMLTGIGWYVLHARNTTDKSLSNASSASSAAQKSSSTSANSKNTISLANNSVKLSLPNGWAATKGTDQCLLSATSKTVTSCLDGAALGVTALGPTSHFSATVSVYSLGSGHSDPAAWFEVDYDGGYPASNDVSSSMSINGNSAWYYEQNSVADKSSYQDENYVIIGAGKVVFVYSRVKETNTNGALNEQNDFTKYLTDIKSIANSVAISQ